MNKMIAGILLNLFLGLIGFEANAQYIKIVAAENGTVLPFATVINQTHPKLVSADINGMAQLTALVGDSIVVSYVGFNNTSFIFNTNTDQTIRLLKASAELAPVIVTSCKKTKSIKYGNKSAVNYKTMQNGERSYFDGVCWHIFQESINPKWAVRLNPEKENSVLKSFSFWLKKDWFGPVSAIKAPLIISFYDVTDSILPGNEIMETPLIYYPQKEGKQKLNLDSLHIRIPKNGIYISFQVVMNEAYEWSKTLKMLDSKKDTVITCFGGRILGAYTKDFELAGFNLIKNKWQNWNKKLNGDNDLHASIKCEAVLKYCED